APSLPTPVEHAVAHGVEQDRLPAVPPDVGGDLHRTVRRMRGTHRTRCLRSILVIYRPQPTAARPATYRFAVFVGLAFVGLTRHCSRSAHRIASSTRQSIQAAPPRTTRKPMTANTYIAVRYHSRSSHIALAPVVVTLASLFFPVRQERWHQLPLICAQIAPTVRAEASVRSEEHTSELQSRENLVCRLLLEKKNSK